MSTNRPAEAETMLLDVLEAFTVLQGDQGEDVLNSLDGLGVVSMTLRKYSEAMDFYQKCLKVSRTCWERDIRAHCML